MRWGLVALCGLLGCRHKISAEACDHLLDRYAELSVHEHSPGLPSEGVAAARANEKAEARSDDNFKNCTSEVSTREFECAIQAPSVADFNKCLE